MARPKIGKQARAALNAPRLAPEQYSELNATLYGSDPASYLRFRLHSLVLMHNEPDDLEEVEVIYGSLTMPRQFDFTAEERQRSLAMESSMLVQHAGESLMRLFLAHAKQGPCPWLDVAKLRFPDVNAALAEISRHDYAWPSGQVAELFLGGANVDEAGVDLDTDDWDATVEAHTELLGRVAGRVLRRAPLYNAVKHGLVGAPSERLGWDFTGPDGQQIRIAEGPVVTYVHGKGTEVSPWVATTDQVRIESDFAIVQAITIALTNLWAVARRRYLGVPGELHLLQRDHVDVAFLAATVLANNHVTSMTLPLRTKTDPAAPWGEGLDLPRIELQAVRVSEEQAKRAQRAGQTPPDLPTAHLPLRPADHSPFTSSQQYLFPFSPAGSSSL